MATVAIAASASRGALVQQSRGSSMIGYRAQATGLWANQPEHVKRSEDEVSAGRSSAISAGPYPPCLAAAHAGT